MIKPICDVCNKELTGFGAILLSPPAQNSTVRKYHVCADCYKTMKGHYNLKE